MDEESAISLQLRLFQGLPGTAQHGLEHTITVRFMTHPKQAITD